MKLTAASCVLLASLLAGCSKNDPGNEAATNANPTSTDSAQATAAVATPSVASATPSVASATGTVEAIDATAGKITLAHEPVEALGWPAMTMGFKAIPEQIAGVQVGQKVNFQFESRGMDATITQIEPAQ